LLCGKTAAALTKGVQSKKTAITLKHFACNNKETNRNSSDSRVSERALREIYLKGFEIAVKESGPWAMMTSYNLINGKETSENYELLTNILRNEWGYDGLVMTDWWNNSSHVLESKAGNDIKMPSGDPNKLRSALKNGSLTRAELEHNIERLLNLIMKTHTW
jgi:beta-glucosidase-like glycosyl hydrolase